MILQVPQALMLNPPGYGGDPNRMIDIGLSGFGQLLLACSDGSSVNSAGLCADGSTPLPAGASPTGVPCYGADFTGPLPPGAQICASPSGQILNSNGTPAVGSGPAPQPGSIPASSIAQVIGAAGNAATSAIMAGNAPAGYVWNAASGRYVPAVAIPGVAVPGGGGLSTTVGISGSIILPIIGLVVAAGLIMVLKK